MQLINGTVWHSLIHNIMKIINNCRTLTPFNKEIKYIQIYSAVNHNRKACLLEKASEEKGFGHMLSCEQHPAPSLWRLPESLRGSKLMPARALGFVISTLAAHLHVAQSAGEESVQERVFAQLNTCILNTRMKINSYPRHFSIDCQ